jgi:hypothetical protein
MLNLSAALLGFVLQLAGNGPTVAQQGCPPADLAMERRISYFLTRPDLAEVRTRYGLNEAAAGAPELRALNSRTDRAACTLLWNVVRSNRRGPMPAADVSFYTAGGMYFVSIDPHSPTDHIHLGEFNVVEVYDREFRTVLRFNP